MPHNLIHQICKSGCLTLPHLAEVNNTESKVTFCCKLGAGKYKRQYAQFIGNKRKGVRYNFKPIEIL